MIDMSKAEDLARKYCEGSSFEDACMEKPAYIAGYHQAEKDNALTWEDILSILKIHVEVYEDETLVYQNKQEVCQEVLKRFKAQKGGKV